MLSIRPAVPSDVPLILELIRELAAYEKEPEAAVATAADLLRDGFSPDTPAKFRCLVASWSGTPAGFAFFFGNYSTWQGKSGLYLEDLFVRPEFRKLGIGQALLIELARIAVREGCGRFQWQVLDWNLPAIEFYEKLGAVRLGEWITMRVDGEALQKMGAEP